MAGSQAGGCDVCMFNKRICWGRSPSHWGRNQTGGHSEQSKLKKTSGVQVEFFENLTKNTVEHESKEIYMYSRTKQLCTIHTHSNMKSCSWSRPESGSALSTQFFSELSIPQTNQQMLNFVDMPIVQNSMRRILRLLSSDSLPPLNSLQFRIH